MKIMEFQKIIRLEDEVIEFILKDATYRIIGKGLHIVYLEKEEVWLSGNISQILLGK